jgi:23S rRNA pseudouridine1911/1915/1917 synthase
MSERLEELYYRPLVAVVREEEHGRTVRAVLERQLGVSRKLLSQVKLTEHGLTVNEARAYTTARVEQGDVIRVRMEHEVSEDILPQPIPLEIVYEDEDLLIVNKPAGMIVHPTHGHYTGTMANGIVHHWRERGERVRFRPVHRLDEETSGIVAVAKTSYVHQQLSEQMQANGFLKRYLAYVYGSPAFDAGVVDEPIDRDPEQPHVRIVTPEGYPSVTHYELKARYCSAEGVAVAAAVSLKLETGRTHQIRVHMKHIGCPLIGDKMYGPQHGAVEAWETAAGRQALHAQTLGFTHPIRKEWMEWTAPLPPELQQLEQLLSRQQ